MAPLEWTQPMMDAISHHLGQQILKIEYLSGGAWSSKYKIQCTNNTYFIKHADEHSTLQASHLHAEYVNLEFLRKIGHLRVPRNLHFLKEDHQEGLIMEFLPAGSQQTSNYWEVAGRMLGNLHLSSFEKYGFHIDNFIGSLSQKNLPWTGSKEEYYIQYRIEPQVALAYEKGLISTHDRLSFDQFYNLVHKVINAEGPQLIHGDLWSGNIGTDMEGLPVFIDAATSYGIREMDLAMSELFGGFPKVFYDSYNEVYPISGEYNQTKSLYTLYFLLVHLNLFGRSYYTSSMECITPFL